MKPPHQTAASAAHVAAAASLTSARPAPARAAGFCPELASTLSRELRGAEAPKPGQPERPVTPAANGGAQLLAAAHAVATYWLVACPNADLEVIEPAGQAPAAYGGGRGPIIRLGQLTPEGGLAAIELLHPELGGLALELSLSGRSVSVLATAGSEHSAAAIRESQSGLAERLAAQNLTLKTLEVVVVRRRKHSRRKES